MVEKRAWFVLLIVSYARFFGSLVATFDVVSDACAASDSCTSSEELSDLSGFVQTVTRSQMSVENDQTKSYLLGSNQTEGGKPFSMPFDGNDLGEKYAVNGQETSSAGMLYASGSNVSSQADWPDLREACKSALLRFQGTFQSLGLQTWLISIAGSFAEIGGGKSRDAAEMEVHPLLMAGVVLAVILAGVGGFFLVRKGLQALSEQDTGQSTLQGMIPRNETLGVVAVTTGAQLGAVGNATCKMLGYLPLMQLMQARFLLQCVCSMGACVVLRWYGHNIHILGQPGKRHLLVARACTFSGALGCLWAALAYMPMGEATAIVYFSPVLCAMLAYIILGEQLNCVFVLQAVLSSVGVLLVILCPTSSSDVHSRASQIAATSREEPSHRYHVGVFFAIVSCVCFALGNIVVRLLKDVNPLEVQVYQDMLTAWVLMPAALLLKGENLFSRDSLFFDWSEWGSHEGFLLLAFTASGLAGSFLLILGFSLAPVQKAAPFVYTELCTSFLLQVCFFGEIPGHCKIIGAVCIVVAALGRMFYELRAEPKEESQDAELLFSSEQEPNAWERLVTPLASPMQTEIYSH